jgi:mannose-6-phosphate isomerase-like protein (cupin superfamily)
MDIAENIKDPAICVARASDGGRIHPDVTVLLNPVDPESFHVFRLPALTAVELHHHDFDEYWAFIEGHPRVTL